ncbi:MAG: hypothetical protein IT305_08520 [Chloroflexi bacterium]|nr:hypothetical protein [Chloroflexota bacterium]
MPARRALAALATHLRGWGWPSIVSLAILGLVEVPHLLADARAAGAWAFAGQFWAPHDVAQYLAAMRDGAAGAWLIRDHLSSEPHAPAFMYGLYVMLGKLAQGLGVAPEIVYRWSGTGARLFLLLALYDATALVTPVLWRRRVAFALAVFGSGIAATLAIVGRLLGLGELPAARELNDPELSTFLVLFGSPHLMVGLGLLLLLLRAVARAARRGGRMACLSALVLTVALGVTNPFSLVSAAAVVVVYAGVRCSQRRRGDRRALCSAGVVVVGSAPFLLYNLLVFGTDPFWGATYGRQNQTVTAPPLEMLAGFGLLVPLVLLGLRPVAWRLTAGRLLVLVWIGVAVALMYAPVGFQRRFAYALHPMLALLAAFGLPPLWHRLRALRGVPAVLVRPLGTAVLAELLIGSSAFFYTFVLVGATSEVRVTAPTDRSAFQPVALRQAVDWLAERTTPEDVVLGQTLTGNLVGGVIPGRAYVGHWVATQDFAAKERVASWFYAGLMDGAVLDDERRAFLHHNGIRFVVVGPYERLLGAGHPADSTLIPSYDADGVAVFAVQNAP